MGRLKVLPLRAWQAVQNVLEAEKELFYPTRFTAMGICDLVKRATGIYVIQE